MSNNSPEVGAIRGSNNESAVMLAKFEDFTSDMGAPLDRFKAGSEREELLFTATVDSGFDHAQGIPHLSHEQRRHGVCQRALLRQDCGDVPLE